MGPNRSLDDFLGGGKSDQNGGDGTTPSDAAEVEDDTTDDDESDAAGADADTEAVVDVDPVESTYRWDPAGGDCAACGSRVERRWRDDGQWVCADCKAW